MSEKICYIANVRIPTEKAHGIQIIKTCMALSNEGVQILLIVPFRYYYGFNAFYKLCEKYPEIEQLNVKIMPVFDHILYESRIPEILKKPLFLQLF